MKVGFTGTREGLAVLQGVAFAVHIEAAASMTEFHHGCCVGADEMAGVLVYERLPFVKVVGYPCDIKGMVSTKAKAYCHELYDPKPPLTRNRNIVDACDVLLACPKGPEEQRSGTWSTVRYARRQGKRVVVIWPDGKVTEE